jgi:hypothetical protein
VDRDIAGRVSKSGVLMEQESEISLTGLAAGLYVVSVNEVRRAIVIY